MSKNCPTTLALATSHTTIICVMALSLRRFRTTISRSRAVSLLWFRGTNFTACQWKTHSITWTSLKGSAALQKLMELVKMVSRFACSRFHLETKPICGRRRYPRDQSQPGTTARKRTTARKPFWLNFSPTPELQDNGMRYPDSHSRMLKPSVKHGSGSKAIRPNALITGSKKLHFSALSTEVSFPRSGYFLIPLPTGTSSTRTLKKDGSW